MLAAAAGVHAHEAAMGKYNNYVSFYIFTSHTLLYVYI